MTPDTEILLCEQPQFPSARLLHTLRWVIARYGLAIAVWPEEDAFLAVYETPEVLADRLVHVPHGLFPAGSQLREEMRQAGVRWNYLPPVANWGFMVDHAAFLAWLAHGTPEPWTPRRQAPAGTLPEDDATFVDAWLGKRADWHGVPLAVRRLP